MIRIPAVLCVLKWRRHNGMAWRVLTLPPFTGRRDGPSSIAAVRRAVRGAVRRAAKRATQRAAHLCSLNAAAHHLLTLLYTMSTSNAPTPASAGPTVGAAPVGPAPAAAVRSNRVDPGWKYISTVEEGNTNDETCPSGCLTLDCALGGGLPKGRIAEIFGPESSGKSTLALHAIADVQIIHLYNNNVLDVNMF
ncbi:hypothetical protein AHAS_Ahas01G0161300 [Arachis hypogaea]